MMDGEEMPGRAAVKKLLIVEDNELNLKLYRDLLQARGYRVLHANEGTAALEIARRTKPDLILMDIQLPGPSGMEVVRWLKEDSGLKTIPVIAVTSRAMKGDEETIREGGFDAYIAIPIQIDHFLETVDSFLQSGPA